MQRKRTALALICHSKWTLLVLFVLCVFLSGGCFGSGEESHEQTREQPPADAESARDKESDRVVSWTVDAQDPWKPQATEQIQDSVHAQPIQQQQQQRPDDNGASPVDQQQEQVIDQMQEALHQLVGEIDQVLGLDGKQGEAKVDAAGGASGASGSSTEMIDSLDKLVDNAASLMTPEMREQLPELVDQMMNAQSLVDAIRKATRTHLLSVEERGAHNHHHHHHVDGDGDGDDPEQHYMHEPDHARKMDEMFASDRYVELEERIEKEGVSAQVIQELRELALDEQEPDTFAMVRYAEMVLFETQGGPPTVANFSEALDFLDIAAEMGFVAAQSTLSLLDLIGFGKPPGKNVNASWQEYKQRALEDLMTLATDHHDFVASLVVGYRIWNGTMHAVDRCHDALFYYHRCAEDNIHRIAEKGGEKPLDYTRLSEKILGANELEDFDHDPGKVEYYRSLAASPSNEMYAEASQRLGEMYFFGDEGAQIPRDQAQAARHFQDAADAGEPHAQANLGMMYANGMGVPQNNETAIKYFRMAAEQGSAFAYHGLGFMYLTGSGVEKNETKAMELFEQAVALGHFDSHTYLGNAYLQGQGVPIDFDKSFEHFRLASESQSSQSIFNLGVMHYRGAGTPPSCELALDHFRKVAVNPDALNSLPFSLARGLQSFEKHDYLRAYLNFRLVAEFGSEAAQCNAAYLLESHVQDIMGLVPDATTSVVSTLVDRENDASSTSDPSVPADQPTGTSTTESDQLPSHESMSDLWWFSPTEAPLQQALTLYTQAAHLNDSEAMRKVGICHYEAWQDACPENKTLAMAFYSQAAEQGDSEAAYRSGVMYTMGDGVAKNFDLAMASFHRCSKAEFPENAPCVLLLYGLKMVAFVGRLLEL